MPSAQVLGPVPLSARHPFKGEERRISHAQMSYDMRDHDSISSIREISLNRSNQLANITTTGASSNITTGDNTAASIVTGKRHSKSLGFKRFRIAKDMEEIEKWLDEKEM